MKRFYTHVTVNEAGHILLDGKPIKTPEGVIIAAPNAALAEAMQTEWERQGEKVDWNRLPVTRLVGGAQTMSASEAHTLRADLAAYVDTDMICYWADEPSLRAQHEAQWQPVLSWVRARHDVALLTTTTITPITQPAAAHEAAARYLAALSPLALVVMGRLAPLLGSLWLAMAVCEGAIDAAAAIEAAHVDERIQASRWGEDAEATAARAAKADEIHLLAGVFLMLGECERVC